MPIATMTEPAQAPQQQAGVNDTQGDATQDQDGSSKRQKSRHRASVACAACRERRIRVNRARPWQI